MNSGSETSALIPAAITIDIADEDEDFRRSPKLDSATCATILSLALRPQVLAPLADEPAWKLWGLTDASAALR